ncbi:MAG: hypothetical protein ACRD8U_17765 [Pyrinomonadaceae bacterium]
MNNNWQLSDNISLDAQAHSPLGVLLRIIAQLPRTLYKIVQFDQGIVIKRQKRSKSGLEEYAEVQGIDRGWQGADGAITKCP